MNDRRGTVEIEKTPDVLAAEEATRQALELLAEIGGRTTSDDDIVFEGKAFKIPEAYRNLTEAGQALLRKAKAEDEIHSFSRVFNFRPMDGAVATGNALRKAFGFTRGKPIMTMFGKRPPQIVEVEVGVGKHVQAPWGHLEVPGFEDTTVIMTDTRHPELGPVFQLIVEAPRRYKSEINGLFELIEKELNARSIYRGKAIDGQVNPRFIDTTLLDPDSVVYTDSVLTQLQANVWSPIQHAKTLAALNQPGKRAVLFEGPYGTGKSLASLLTAQIAVANKWTFIQCRPGRDSLELVLQTARMYQPAVVFFEDLDTLAEPRHGEEDQMSRLLDLFDGVDTKGLKMLLVLTTNHVEKLHKGMLRPGRLDAVISIGALDRSGVEKLCRYVLGDSLDDDVDFDAVAKAMDGYMPAFVKEAIDRTIRYSVSANDGKMGRVSTKDLVAAAEGLRAHLELQEGSRDAGGEHPFIAGMQDMVTTALGVRLDGAQLIDNNDGEATHTVKAATRIGANGS